MATASIDNGKVLLELIGFILSENPEIYCEEYVNSPLHLLSDFVLLGTGSSQRGLKRSGSGRISPSSTILPRISRRLVKNTFFSSL